MPEQRRPARRHHVVSKFYLRRFANAKQQLMRHPLVGKAHLQSVNDATVRKDFYTLTAHGVEQDAFETHLAELEAEAAAAFTATLRDRAWPPTPEHRFAVSAWIGLQYLRGENNRRMIEELDRAFSKLEVGIATTNQVRERLNIPAHVPDNAVEAMRAEMLATADTRPIDHRSHLMSIVDNLAGTVASIFDRRPWILVDFATDVLGTSDTPVKLVADDAALAAGMGVGIVSAKELYVPLSARAALCIGSIGGTGPDERGHGHVAFARFLNERMLYTARRALYSHPAANPFAGFVMLRPRQQEVDVPHEQIDGLIEAAARAQGRASGLPVPEV